MDRDARPVPKDMKLWVDVLRFVKRGARGGALGFFTYMELSTYQHFGPSSQAKVQTSLICIGNHSCALRLAWA